MDSSATSEITVLLRAWSSGDRGALERLLPLVYQKLYAAAQRYMAHERPGHILQNSALVNELYLELAKLDSIDWRDRNHFYAVCAQFMRRILTTYARSRHRLKRGGDIEHVTVDDNVLPNEPNWCAGLVTLDDAMKDLGAFDERMLRIVELRAFVGLSVEETALALNISERTVRREWNVAAAWLLRELSREKTDGR
jgi:RNA polymerase sigma-70 factor (ECF subfamily)